MGGYVRSKEKKTFLVARPEPAGNTALRRVRARSKDESFDLLPDAEIWDPPPEWMTDEHLQRLDSSPVLDIDEPLDTHLMTEPPDLVFDRNDPPPGARMRDPDALTKARKMFRKHA